MNFKKFSTLIVCYLITCLMVGVGFVLFAIPGIYIVIAFIFLIYPVVLIGNNGVFQSISKVFQLVWGNWWRTFITVLLIMFTIGVISSAVIFIINLPAILYSEVVYSSWQHFTWFGLFMGIIAITVASFIEFLLIIAGMLTLHNDLSIRYKQKQKLNEMLEQLVEEDGKQQQTDSNPV